MQSLENQARSFFLQCRARAWRAGQRSRSRLYGPQHSSSSSQARTLASGHRTRGPSPPAPKPFYSTTPIYYVNSSPHAGHLYSMVLADVLKRWHQLKNEPAQMLTGTDEHGIKVQRAAEEAGADTYAFCTQHAEQFQSLADTANISYDRFFRTTDADHKEAVAHFWRELNRQGYIYEAKHEGWYCVSDETFYPESQVHMVLEPSSGEKIMASVETGKEVVWTSEINYHFRLSDFRDRLLEHYESNPKFIIPRQRMNFIIKEVESGLSDLSISRPKERLSWGIPVPDDPSQTIYVWFDALINYITHTGYPYTAPGEPSIWPADVQVIGKDIIRFHTIYWPAFLMALNLPVPRQFLSHAHWTMNTQKMSKSVGNVVNPFGAMKRFGVDAIRYYMVRDGGLADDAPYENMYIVRRYKSELQGQLGNLLNRISRTKFWDVGECIQQCSEEVRSPPNNVSTYLEGFQAVQRFNTDIVLKSDEAMRELNMRQATDAIFSIIDQANHRFHQAEPWRKVKERDEASQLATRWAVFEAADSLRVAAILLQPFMPAKMTQALDMLGVPPEQRHWHAELANKVPVYGKPFFDLEKGERRPEQTLFPPLLSEN
ncbi:methionine-tRNA ligase [Cyphellophora europaea CBS 101466]|uniref:Probable methionine--tRNA ligase, mitochondrial n=1 Tax=Cyphellophora europaea (strain CBS 101466) TaxID=1220924 RepID=W2RQI0_CYPE1|nr:methionine-tRNA ligase [Cyphellophora europaea CBS 101466]ETN38575.1 methionine-tRNA ligase [Cyphellophora europaea CBS 101466]